MAQEPVFRNICLVHYHEIGLKGRNRPRFERQLKGNIEKALSGAASPLTGGCVVSRISGRLLLVLGDFEDAWAAARRVALIPGVVRVSVGLRTVQQLEAVYEAAQWLMERREAAAPWQTFKVDARRANTNFATDSMELNRIIGQELHERFSEKTIRMQDPDLRLHVEMVEGSAFVYCDTMRGVGGLPVGSAGRVVCLLSAGLDSPVAAWRLMRRGARVTALHFSGRPETPDTSEHLVVALKDALAPYGGMDRLLIVPFGSYQRSLSLLVPADLRVIFYRRLMFAVGNAVAEREGAKALVTGESLGQVASQTLDNILVVDAVSQLPVLRPLIGTDKQEIIDEALRIGTFELSSQSHEDCCTLFMPRNPETHAKLSVVEPLWNELPIAAWVDEILTGLYQR
ncbi:MAG: tRNA 4-thiouridine(8) synthase ThiI [Coriobacteriales bacterium]|nr:tRNA 4-thiouridine(8) synthase ThiI [Coriobacteriales bacterium]